MRGKQQYGVPDAENPEWTAEDFRNAKRFDEVLPPAIVAEIRRRGRGVQKAPTKQMVSIRLDVDVLAKWRASGKGWQGRVNDTLAVHAPRRARAARAKVTAARVRPAAARAK